MLTVAIAVAAAGLATTAAAQDRFTDVSSGSHKANIEALETLGVFDGTECGARRFCPTDPAKRWAVAVWIVRVVDGRDPYPVQKSRFADVDDDEWWMPYVERLADLGVTVGCKQSPLRYCPDDTVTRAQMASFLVRAFRLQRAASAGFADTAGSTHEANIDALYAAGLTVGCKQRPLRYCGSNPVTRSQMASFLNRGRGQGTTTPTTPTTPPTGTITIRQRARSADERIAVTRGRTCIVRPDEGVTCWGGDEGYLEHLSASDLYDVAALSTGHHEAAGLHTCAVHDNGDVSCWGPGSQGQLGAGTTSTNHLPQRVPGIYDATAVAAGPFYTCVVHTNGGVSCWGLNTSGQLGDGTTTPNRLSPTPVRGLRAVAAIAAGENHVCALDDYGDVSCWGWVYGNTPATVAAPDDVTSVAIGGTQTCITTDSGLVYCWNYRATAASQMTRVANITDAVKVSVGDGTACALHSNGTVSCWGQNALGQVGDGTTTLRTTPVRLAGIGDAEDISVGSGTRTVGAHACALRRTGAVMCWGGNNLGQLGNATLANSSVPRAVSLPAAVPLSRRPTTSSNLLLTWVDSVVQNRRSTYAWLQDAWDHVYFSTYVGESGSSGGDVTSSCYVRGLDFGCTVTAMTITDISLATVIRELARVYDLHTGLAPRRAWGAAQLYFASKYPQCLAGTDLHGSKVLADTVLHVMVPHAPLEYYGARGCRGVPLTPAVEAEQVASQALAGRVPDWYTTQIFNGLELWTAWLRGPSLPALANLRDEFGGLCSTTWVTSPLTLNLFPTPRRSPFLNDRCF